MAGGGLPEQLSIALAGGLLSSSCCVLQLALNALSIGCAGELPLLACLRACHLSDMQPGAGFGSLTPFRHYFTAATAISLALTHARYKDRRRTAVAALLALALTSSPELVRRWNLGGAKQQAPGFSLVQARVEGMKCLACAARLKQAVQMQLPEPGAACSVELESGLLSVYNSSLSAAQLLGIVRTQGFQGRLVREHSKPAQAWTL